METQTRSHEELDQEAAARLAGLECKRCRSEGWLEGDARNDEDWQPCPDCQGTGLAFPELSWECGVLQLVGEEFHFTIVAGERESCQTCNGTKRIPVPPEKALYRLMEHPDCVMVHRLADGRRFVQWNITNADGPTPLTTLDAAILAAREAK